MKYTRSQYETFYYLHKLLPYLKTKRSYQRDLMAINVHKMQGRLVPQLGKIDPYEPTKERAKGCRQIEKALAEYGPIYTKLPPSPQQNNISYLVRVFHLNSKEEAVIRFLSVIHYNDLFKRCLNEFEGDIPQENEALALIAGCPCGMEFSILNKRAPIKQLGIMREVRYGNGWKLTNWALGFINTAHKNDDARYKALIGSPLACNAEFTGKDFSYLEAADLALRLMKQAKRTKGFNILLYGAPGTGKTSFAKVLAQSANLDLYPVGVCNNGEEEHNYRLQQLYRQQFLLKHVKKACLLFDEGEDMFSSLETCTSKVEINNLLENNDVPVIWTTNKIQCMDPAYIRRFTLAVYFDKPPVEVRQKIWNKYLSVNKIICTTGDTFTLAKKYEVPPAMIAGAAQAARMAKGNLTTVKEHLSFMEQALHGGYKKPAVAQDTPRFYPALIHADVDLRTLTAQLRSLGRLNFSLCLYGASGTGKSAYARYLAEQLGLEVQQRRASDLINPFVGETEQKIARAFAVAKENKALLVFDEADSFLRDRSMAVRSWEVSSVNEMLTWMESHPYPFICTTNLMDTLDPASLRRFSFKVKYDFLTAQQVKEAFSCFFGLDISLQQAAGLDKLTPGDFTLVKNKAEILGQSTRFDALKELLETEQKLKHSAYGKSIGFRIN